jgi:hypothetical protein
VSLYGRRGGIYCNGLGRFLYHACGSPKLEGGSFPDLGEEEIISRNNETIKSPAMAAPTNIRVTPLPNSCSDRIRVKRRKTGSSDSPTFLISVVSICHYQERDWCWLPFRFSGLGRRAAPSERSQELNRGHWIRRPELYERASRAAARCFPSKTHG